MTTITHRRFVHSERIILAEAAKPKKGADNNFYNREKKIKLCNN